MGDDKCRALDLFDDVGHGEGLSGACHSQQNLVRIAPIEPFHKFGYGIGLVTPWREGGNKLESFVHQVSIAVLPVLAGGVSKKIRRRVRPADHVSLLKF